jgi:hypothetical protein
MGVGDVLDWPNLVPGQLVVLAAHWVEVGGVVEQRWAAPRPECQHWRLQGPGRSGECPRRECLAGLQPQGCQCRRRPSLARPLARL